MSAGCLKPTEPSPAQPREGIWQSSVLGHSVENRPIELLTAGSGPDVVLIMATIHGNEWAGTPIVNRLAEYIAGNSAMLEGRRVLLLPVANPDGYAKKIRHNVRGVDLNRNFPADNYQTSDRHGDSALSEPESRALHELLLKHRPARIVSIHQPLVCIDYDGPAEGLARAMGRYSELPVKKLGGRPGSLGSFAGESLGIPIITLELPPNEERLSPDALWARHGRMLMAAVTFPKEPPMRYPCDGNRVLKPKELD